jgi:hypothetical protein
MQSRIGAVADQQVDELVDALNRHNGPEWVSALEVTQMLEALSRAGLAVVPAAGVLSAEGRAVLEACRVANFTCVDPDGPALSSHSGAAIGKAILACRAAKAPP